jgi:uncharacterized protein (UPF0333 family)
MMIAQRGQVSTEFMIVLGISLIILVGIMQISFSNSSAFRLQGARLQAEQVANKVAAEINAAFLAGDDVRRTFYIPDFFTDGTSYNVSVYGTDHSVVVEWDKEGLRNHNVQIIAGNINGTTTGLWGQINLTNIGGVIQVN